MKVKFKAVLFDLDGTLVDTEQLIRESFNYALKQQGFPGITSEQQARLAGMPLSKIYPLISAKGNLEKLINDHREFALKNVNLAKKYPSTIKVLKKIRKMGTRIGVITGRYRKSTEQILEKMGLQKFVDILVCGDDFEESKPGPKPYLSAIQKLGLKPKECLVVGDGWVDVTAGKKAGCTVARAMYGYGAREECMEQADMQISKLEEVIDCILQRK